MNDTYTRLIELVHLTYPLSGRSKAMNGCGTGDAWQAGHDAVILGVVCR